MSGVEFLQNRERLSNENSANPVFELKEAPDSNAEVGFNMQYRKEGSVSLSNERYIHEQKIILFIIETAKSLTALENAFSQSNNEADAVITPFQYPAKKVALLVMLFLAGLVA